MNVDPNLAADLTKRPRPRQAEEAVAELTEEAFKKREYANRLELAALWARSMHRMFKGHGRSRRFYALAAIEKFKLQEDRP